MCARRDHYSESHTAKFFQLNAALLLIDHMYGESEEPRGVDKCPICRDAVAEWDAGCQLEPCRHWLCARCARDYMQARDNDECPVCRERVAEYVSGRPFSLRVCVVGINDWCSIIGTSS